jgi:hypothetical protein
VDLQTLAHASLAFATLDPSHGEPAHPLQRLVVGRSSVSSGL